MPPMNAAAPVLTGIRDWSEAYDVALCDVWGVLHDGITPHPAAARALINFRRRGGTVVLVSNAPRPAIHVMPHLDNMKVTRDAWDAFVTSGDVTRALIEKQGGRPYYWLGPERDAPLFEGLEAQSVPFEQAEFIVCTGLYNDDVETPDDYREILGRALDRSLPMICANPDIVVERGDKLIYCAGAVAEAYAAMGGDVAYAGKPHGPIYAAALELAASRRGREVEMGRVFALGDALRTDVAGANGLGVASLFVARGIHTHELGIADEPLDQARLDRLLATATVRPTAAIDKLAW
jgi:HAD superfamily hydrolase (TIGR01459 family)